VRELLADQRQHPRAVLDGVVEVVATQADSTAIGFPTITID
jgi:hypothetical protein